MLLSDRVFNIRHTGTALDRFDFIFKMNGVFTSMDDFTVYKYDTTGEEHLLVVYHSVTNLYLHFVSSLTSDDINEFVGIKSSTPEYKDTTFRQIPSNYSIWTGVPIINGLDSYDIFYNGQMLVMNFEFEIGLYTNCVFGRVTSFNEPQFKIDIFYSDYLGIDNIKPNYISSNPTNYIYKEAFKRIEELGYIYFLNTSTGIHTLNPNESYSHAFGWEYVYTNEFLNIVGGGTALVPVWYTMRDMWTFLLDDIPTFAGNIYTPKQEVIFGSKKYICLHNGSYETNSSHTEISIRIE